MRLERDRAIVHRVECPRTRATGKVGTRGLPCNAAIQHSATRHSATGLLPHPPTQHPPPARAVAGADYPTSPARRPRLPPSDRQRHANVSVAPNPPQRRLAGGQPAPLPHGFAVGSVRIVATSVSRGRDGPLGRAYMSTRSASTARTPPPVRDAPRPSLRPRPRVVGAGWRRLSALCRASPAPRPQRGRCAPPLNPTPTI